MHTQVLEVQTGPSEAVVDVTAVCARFLTDRRVADGILHVFVPHATAGVVIIETGSGTEHDLLEALDGLLPPGRRYRHQHGSRGHGRDHVVPAFCPPYASIPVVNGELALGTWQSICVVDTNRDNPVRTLRLSFLPG